MKPVVRGPRLWVILPILVILIVVNALNNVWAPALYVPVSIAAAIALIWIARQDGLYWTDLGLGPHWVRNGLRWGLPVVGLIAIVYTITILMPGSEELFSDARRDELTLWQTLWLAFVRVPLGTVLLEEVAFRGVLFGLFRRRFGPWGATLGSSLLFGIWHVLPSLQIAQSVPVIGQTLGPAADASLISVMGAVVFTTLAGVALVMLRRWSHSLLAPALAHWATNGLGYIFSWLARAA